MDHVQDQPLAELGERARRDGEDQANPNPNPNPNPNQVSVADVTEKIKQCAAAAVTGKAEL